MAERIICEGLLQVGILQGELEQVYASRVTGIFFPHGLGHSLGTFVQNIVISRSRRARPTKQRWLI